MYAVTKTRMYRPGILVPDVFSDLSDSWKLVLYQPPHGYRFSLDAFLLADFVPPVARQPMIDLGTGCGVVALLLARRFSRARMVGLELQTELAVSARQNVVRNHLQHQMDIVQADVRTVPSLLSPGTFGTVVSNPPYRQVGRGRLNPQASKAMARHEVALTLSQLLHAARQVVQHHGLLVMIYHPSRLAELCTQLEHVGFRLRRLRLVHPKPHAAASMVLVEAVRGGRDALEVLPPLFVCGDDGRYTAEMQAIFNGRGLGGQHE